MDGSLIKYLWRRRQKFRWTCLLKTEEYQKNKEMVQDLPKLLSQIRASILWLVEKLVRQEIDIEIKFLSNFSEFDLSYHNGQAKCHITEIAFFLISFKPIHRYKISMGNVVANTRM